MVRAADDIPPRFEMKYLLTPEEERHVRRVIAPHCVLDSFSAREPDHRYLITSLYLDTPHLGCFRAWELAAPRRFKLRIRRYGKELGDSPVFLEVKERIQDMILKHRCVIPTASWAEIASRGVGGPRAQQEFTSRRDWHRMQPALLVRYRREAYKGITEAYARATFDSAVEYQRVEDWDLHGDDRGWSSGDDPLATGEDRPRILLELKFEKAVPRWMVHVMRELELVRRGFSKYGVGVRRAYGKERLLDPDRREPVGA